MVKISYNQNPYHRIMMETRAAKCVASPSTETEADHFSLRYSWTKVTHEKRDYTPGGR
ncbi:MAG: hypothetical protein PVG99_12935 [Desulfobacteraceae bacterium]